MTQAKIRKVIDFPRPLTLKEVQSFLGVTGYYRKFIRSYASIANPLNNLTHKDTEFHWTDEHTTSFETLKELFNRDVPLQMPDYSKPFIIDTDASDIAVGAVLGQIDANGHERPVFFASRKLSPAEKKWPVRDKEALAILFACQSFRHHILGTHFTIRSDHHSLQWLMDAHTGRIARWATILAEYEPFDIQYRRGESNKVADALSRVYAWSECMPDIAFACAQIAIPDDNDADIMDETLSPIDPPNITNFIDIPSHKMLLAAQSADDFCIKQRVRQLDNQSNIRNDRGYIIRDGLLGLDRNGRFLPILPEIFRDKFLKEVHCHPLTAHMGAKRVAARAGEIFAIPKLRTFARKICAGCDNCLRRKKPQPKAGSLSSQPPSHAWEQISMDYCGPYPTSISNKRYVLVVIDQFTKFVHLTPCTHANAQTAYRVLYEKIICNYGTPQKILTDNGSHFRNKWLAAVCTEFKIAQTFSSPYYPQGDGQVERFMRNMNDSLSALCVDNPTLWCSYIPGVQCAYNNTPHAATFIAPYELLYGSPPPPIIRLSHTIPAVPITKDAADEAAHLRSTIEQVSERVRKQIQRTWMQRALSYNIGRSKIHIVVGDRCLIRLTPAQLNIQPSGKLRVRWSEPVKVVGVKQSGKAFDVMNRDGRTFVVNATRMLPLPPTHWHPRSATNDITWSEDRYEPQFPGLTFCTAGALTNSSGDDHPVIIDLSPTDSPHTDRTAETSSHAEQARQGSLHESESVSIHPSASSSSTGRSTSTLNTHVSQPSQARSSISSLDSHRTYDAPPPSPIHVDAEVTVLDDELPIFDSEVIRGIRELELSSHESRATSSVDTSRNPSLASNDSTYRYNPSSDSELSVISLTTHHSPTSPISPQVHEP
jgi:transposase InsO family protein